MSKRDRRPLEPFASFVSFLARATLGLLVLGLIGTFWGGAHGWDGIGYGIGDRQVCVQTTDFGVGGAEQGMAPVVRPGVTASEDGMTLCYKHPSGPQQILNVVSQLPSAVVSFGALILLWWLVAGARRDGPFAAVNSTRLRLIGWWLVVGGVLAANVQQVAHNVLVDATLRAEAASPDPINHLPQIPWTLLIAGLGMLTVARILSVGTAMYRELEATI